MALGPDTRKNSLSARGPSTHDLGINNADNFRIGKRLANLPKLREIGFAANRWLLEVERLSHEMHSRRGRINRPITLNGQRARLPLCRSAQSPRRPFRPHPRDDRARGNDQFRRLRLYGRPTLAVVLPSHHAVATLLKRSFDTPDTRIIGWLAQPTWPAKLDTFA
jgi:hypothetical protein